MRNEKEIGKKAEQMLQDALRQKVSGFYQHVNGGEKSKERLEKETKAVAKIKRYNPSGENPQVHYYLRSLAIKMQKWGFIQHYGVDTIRAGGHRTRTKPKTTKYGYKAHHMNMAARPFIDRAIDESGVVPFVLQKVTEMRGQEVMAYVKGILESEE